MPRHAFNKYTSWSALVVLALRGVCVAHAQGHVKSVQIDPQPLATALLEFARQANVDVIAPATLVSGRRSPGVSGELQPEAALSRLLEGTGLRAVSEQVQSFVLVPDSAAKTELAAQARHALRIAKHESVGPADAAPDSLVTVVVTANKRSQRLQDTPLALTALTAHTLSDMGAENFEDYARSIPGVSFVDNGPSHKKIVIRGISTDIAPESNAATALYFDDVPLTSSGGNPEVALVDMQRVEVLRGPQGTLYGDAAMGGTVRLIAAKPDMAQLLLRGETSVSATDHGGANWGLRGVVNLPVAEHQLAIRLVGYSRRNAGFIRNETLGTDDVNDETTSGGRFATRWKPRDDTTVTLNAMHQESSFGARNTYTPAVGDLVQTQRFLEPLRDAFTVASLNAEFNLGFGLLYSSTSYQRRTLRELRDWTAVVAINLPELGGAPATLGNTGKGASTFVQELRLSSRDSAPWHWLAGTYFSERSGGLPQRVVVYRPEGPLTVLQTILVEADNRQISAFGEIGYDFTPRLSAAGGLRAYSVESSNAAIAEGALIGGHTDQRGESRHSGVIPRFSLTYRLDAARLLYAQAAKGFRHGGPTGTGVPPLDGIAPPTQYGPDSLWSYELGAKSSWFDDALIVNADVFLIEWNDIQTTIARSDGYFLTVNAGSARSRGVELEMVGNIGERWTASLSGALIDAELSTNQLPPNDGLAGQNMPGVPKRTLSASVRYMRPLPWRDWTGFVQADYRYVAESFNGFRSAFGSYGTLPADVQPAYDLGNLRVGIRGSRGEITLYCDNFWDERAALFVDRISELRYHTNRPRTVGINLKRDFQ